MRIVIRLALVLVVLLAVALGALALMLPRIVRSDAVRTRIETAAEQALGRKVRYADLDFGLLPPSLLVKEPSVAAAQAGAPPLVQADEVALRVALAPLLTRTVVVDSLVVEGATLRLVRTAKGIELPTPPPRKEAPEEPEAGSPVAIAMRSVALHDTTLILEDRAVSPPVTWELRKVDATARGKSLDDPISFEVAAELASGGRLEAEGTARLDGALEAKVLVQGLALAPVRSYVPDASELAGSLSGRIQARGPAGGLESIGADLEIRDARLAMSDVALQGKLGLRADLAGGLATPSGTFDVDATDASLSYGEAFQKPSGRAATLSGRLVTREDGSLGIEDAKLKVHDLKADGSLRLGKRIRLTAVVAPFDVAGWEEMLPALAKYKPSGRLDIGEVKVATSPTEVYATIPLDGLRAQHPDAGPVELHGSLVARGDVIETRDMTLVAAEQTIHVAATVRDLGTTPRFQLKTQTEGTDTNRLVSAFTSRKDTFFGVLNFDGDLSGTAGDSLVRSLRGQTRLDIQDGRIVGLSLLEATFDAIAGKGAGGVAAAGLNLASILTGKSFERYYGDDFQSLTGTLRLADGRASTNDLRLVYRGYTVDLKGGLGLEDGGYEMTGVLTLGKEIDETLAAELGGGQAQSGRPPVIPIGLKGNLGEPFGLRKGNPRLAVTSEVATALVSRYALDRYGKKIDEAVGVEGASEAVRGVLDILGGGKKR